MSGLGIVTGLAVEARILARVVRRSATAIHIIHAAGDPAAVAQSLAAKGVASLMSFGIAGGLDPALGPGKVIVASEIIEGGGERYECQASWRNGLMTTLDELLPLCAPLMGSDSALATVADKAALHARHGAAAVDMESHEVGLVAARCALPFAAVRVIADPAGRVLPSSALAGFNERGETQVAAVLWELARHPVQLPALLGVARDSRKAFSTLNRCANLLFGGG